MSTAQVLQHLYSLDTSSSDVLRYLYCLLRSDDEEQHLTTLQGSELIRLVDFLDEILDAIPIADDVFRRCLHKLRTICGHNAILPSSYAILGDLARVGDDPFDFGGFSDVWKGTHNGRKVCIKRLRLSEQSREAVEKAFCKEAITWKRFEHPNVVAFIGATRNPLQFVSEWMPNGTLTNYVINNPRVNRVGLLLDVAEGLDYIHANHTTHGDLKGPNILIDHTGHACLADFGLTSVVRGLSSVLVTNVQGYTERWAAPEVLESGDRNTREADVYSFGMVVVEVFTGKSPFSEFNHMVTVSKIISGERPDRPREPSLTDSVWEVTLACWQQVPACRPAMAEVVRSFRECYRPYAANLQVSCPSRPQPAKKESRAKGVDCVTTPVGFPSAYRRINELSRGLANEKEGPKGKHYIELSQLCTLWHTVPASYGLGGVVMQGDRAQRVSGMTEIWEGTYDGETVALKVLRLPPNKSEADARKDLCLPTGDSDIKMAKQRFCAAAVLMKQIEHKNIIPFYGVSTTISDFCLVFPWYKNGDIEQYLKKNPDIDRYDLARLSRLLPYFRRL
ncbi:kinase-like domain-containing protein [Thelephora terrestris]|uniref:Kinase-like domain-containing protein n=1 Tax=Thelephora terrestris TaxID=56493 RepID=A0A9P6HEH7_9AGAM|nr:kinase-like domain-containing protein [Thelephora terrestris]